MVSQCSYIVLRDIKSNLDSREPGDLVIRDLMVIKISSGV